MTGFDPILIAVDNAGPLTGAGNNTYLLSGADRHASLIDAGTGTPAHLASLARHLADLGADLTTVLVTHGHADHTSGAAALASRFANAAFFKYIQPLDDDPAVAWQHVEDGQIVEAGGQRLMALHTPGHAPDHLVFWHADSRTAFTGDLISPTGSVLIAWSRGGDLTAYLASVERLLAFAPARLLPAHGPSITDPSPVLRATIDHRLRRHAQILDAVHRGCRTVPAIAESIYDGLEPALLAAARENVRAHLEKLKHDGLAIDDGAGWRSV